MWPSFSDGSSTPPNLPPMPPPGWVYQRSEPPPNCPACDSPLHHDEGIVVCLWCDSVDRWPPRGIAA